MTRAFTNIPPCPMLAPLPVVLVSCKGADTRPNLITVGWAGMVCSNPPMLSISLRKERHSYNLVASTGEFVVNLVNEKILQATDFCGVKSGRDMDKFEACGLTPMEMSTMDHAPALLESPVHLACKVAKVIPLGSHDMFIAQIVQVEVDSGLLDKKGGLHLEAADLVCYNHGLYQALGEPLGFFGHSLAGEETFKRRMATYGKEALQNIGKEDIEGE